MFLIFGSQIVCIISLSALESISDFNIQLGCSSGLVFLAEEFGIEFYSFNKRYFFKQR